MRKDNRGLSMVELVVAIAIMAVLGSMLVIGLGIIPRTNARACANGLKSAIGQAKILTMGKQETIFILQRDTDRRYYTLENVDEGNGTFVLSQPELCGKSNVTVSYHVANGSDPLADIGNYTELTPGDSMTLSFERGTGKLRQGGSPGSSDLCDAIRVEGGGAIYTVRIYTATGKVTLDN